MSLYTKFPGSRQYEQDHSGYTYQGKSSDSAIMCKMGDREINGDMGIIIEADVIAPQS
jgi:hypothetical protein